MGRGESSRKGDEGAVKTLLPQPKKLYGRRSKESKWSKKTIVEPTSGGARS